MVNGHIEIRLNASVAEQRRNIDRKDLLTFVRNYGMMDTIKKTVFKIKYDFFVAVGNGI